jgi:chemotaxis protein MotB
LGKRQVHEEHENHERWLVSYADFITLLFAFFVVLYSVSRQDVKKVTLATKAIQWAMHYAGTGGIGAPPVFEGPPTEGGCSANLGGSGNLIQQVRAIEGVRRKVEKQLRQLLIEKQKTQAVSVEQDGKRLTIRLAASRFFEAGSASLVPDALPVLDAVAEELKQVNRPIRVEGHTDDSPAGGAGTSGVVDVTGPAGTAGHYRNNWELSAGRAAMVTAYLETAHKIPATRLSAVGYGATRPLVPNDSTENRELNRRIAFVIEVTGNDPLGLAAGP